ncbi:MAG: hypothetical protein ACI8ZN_000658 [Bacteroidia bacterium]|jgi:hypothetical protein
MKKVLSSTLWLVILAIIFPTNQAYSQIDLYKRSAVEVEIGTGFCFFFGDLGGGSGSRKDAFLDFDTRSIGKCLSAGFKRNLTNKLALRFDLGLSTVHGNDAYSEEKNRKSRNLRNCNRS